MERAQERGSALSVSEANNPCERQYVVQRGKNNIHGWLVIDKPEGISSAAVVGKVKRLTGAKKVGHGGTLDPYASGILPIALGEATKTFAWVASNIKTYRFSAIWGQATATDDREGEVTTTSGIRPSHGEIEAMLSRFTGDIEQVPPVYSALKVNGKRAYALARAGETVELAPRTVHIESLSLDSAEESEAIFTVTCGKGTYVRALARDIAAALGTVAHVGMLRRTAVGGFSEANAISLEKLEEMVHKGLLDRAVLPVDAVLDDIPACVLRMPDVTRIRQGMPVELDGNFHHDGQILRGKHDNRLVAIGTMQHGKFIPNRVFNY